MTASSYPIKINTQEIDRYEAVRQYSLLEIFAV
jgi:hypothetical protein